MWIIFNMKISQSTVCDKRVIEALAGLNKPLGTKAKLQKLHFCSWKGMSVQMRPPCVWKPFCYFISVPHSNLKAALQLNVCKVFWTIVLFSKSVYHICMYVPHMHVCATYACMYHICMYVPHMYVCVYRYYSMSESNCVYCRLGNFHVKNSSLQKFCVDIFRGLFNLRNFFNSLTVTKGTSAWSVLSV